VQDEVIYRCVHAACARALPRRVNFCPYCGTGQHAGVGQPAPAIAAEEAPRPPPAAAAPDITLAKGPAQPTPRVAAPAPPPQRQPVRLRYWLLALAALWLIWIYARPTTKKIDARIERAIALTVDCRFNDAQSELIALRSTKATAEQLLRLQTAINEAVPACERKRKRMGG
jgi:hypothetical protein